MSGENTGQGGERKAVFENIEETARRMGWKPEAEFKGPKDKWRPAEEYVETAMQNYPVLTERYRILDSRAAKTERELREANAKLDDVGKAVIEMRDFQQEALKRSAKEAYDRGRADLEKEIREATAAADPQRTEAALAKLREHEASKPKEDEPAKPTKKAATDDDAGAGAGKREIDGQPKPKIAPEVTEWISRNPWYNTVPKLNVLAVALHNELRETNPELSLAENLERVEEEIKSRFPEHFDDDPPARRRKAQDDAGDGDLQDDNPRRNGAPVVNEPSEPRRRRDTNKRTYADLPPDAKAACDRFAKTMIKGKDGKMVPMMTRDEYVAQYDWEGR